MTRLQTRSFTALVFLVVLLSDIFLWHLRVCKLALQVDYNATHLFGTPQKERSRNVDYVDRFCLA